uniref:Uncharacterized protein n=1 Tax=Anopheles maculatus TaxID=74869 RepID=A0A182SYM5_9DIPT
MDDKKYRVQHQDESVRLYLACWLQKYCASWFDRDQDLQSIFSKAFLEKILQIIVRYLTDEPNKGYLDRATTLKLNIVEELVSKPINEQFMDMCTNYIHVSILHTTSFRSLLYLYLPPTTMACCCCIPAAA